MSCLARARFEDRADGVHQARPTAFFLFELRASTVRQHVVFGPAIVLRRTPCRFKQPLPLEPVERRIERPLLNFQRSPGNLSDSQQNAVTVHFPERNCFENQ